MIKVFIEWDFSAHNFDFKCHISGAVITPETYFFVLKRACPHKPLRIDSEVESWIWNAFNGHMDCKTSRYYLVAVALKNVITL